VGEPDRFGHVAPDRRLADEDRGLPAPASHGRDEERQVRERKREETVGAQELPADGRIPREPLSQRRLDPRKVGTVPRDGHDRDAQRVVNRVQVDDVEPADDRAVQEDGAQPLQAPSGADEPDDLGRGAPPASDAKGILCDKCASEVAGG